MNRTCQVSKMNQNIIGLTISRNVRAVNDRPFSISAPINPLCSRFGYFDGVARCVASGACLIKACSWADGQDSNTLEL